MVNGTNKFFRSKKPDHYSNCSYCDGYINRGQWIGWNRKKGSEAKSWHWDCERINDDPPYELQFHRSDLANGTTTIPTTTVDVPPPPVVETPTTAINPNDGLGAFATILAPYLDGKINAKTTQALDDLKASLKLELEDAVEKLRSSMTVTVQVDTPNQPSVKIDNAHKQLPKLIALCSIRKWPYLYGLAGGFKSTSAQKAAEALGLPFESIQLTATTFASELKGYNDANGVYQPSGFRRCFENGGIFLIDEIDNASGNLLTVLNSALANGHYAFPDKMVTKHADFICIATGNTAGRGASRNHAERRALDQATLDRFQLLHWEHDWNLTKSITLSINPKADAWFNWVRKTHDFCQARYPQVACSPRSAMDGAAILKTNAFTVHEVATMTVYKGIDAESVKAIESANPLPAC